MRFSAFPSVSFTALACMLVGSSAAFAVPTSSSGSSTQRPWSEAVGLDVVADRIRASAATLPGTPGLFDQKFIQYAYMSRKELASGGVLSNGTLKLKRELAAQPGNVFDTLVRFEAAQDCTGTATMALYSTAVELAPRYPKLAELIDVRLAGFERADEGADPFPFIKCSSDPQNRTSADNSSLALSLVLMKREMIAQGATGFVSSSTDPGVASRLSAASRDRLKGLHPRPIKVANPG